VVPQVCKFQGSKGLALLISFHRAKPSELLVMPSHKKPCRTSRKPFQFAIFSRLASLSRADRYHEPSGRFTEAIVPMTLTHSRSSDAPVIHESRKLCFCGRSLRPHRSIRDRFGKYCTPLAIKRGRLSPYIVVDHIGGAIQPSSVLMVHKRRERL
jgi:hypothetical protein